jgi:hypothetical protein
VQIGALLPNSDNPIRFDDDSKNDTLNDYSLLLNQGYQFVCLSRFLPVFAARSLVVARDGFPSVDLAREYQHENVMMGFGSRSPEWRLTGISHFP